MKNLKAKNKDLEKMHRWRLCPYGKHWVQEHIKHVSGKDVIWHAHCAFIAKFNLYLDQLRGKK